MVHGVLIISYQLVTNLQVGIQLLDDDDDVQWFNVHIKADLKLKPTTCSRPTLQISS